MGKPVLIGPHTFNFSEATDLAVAAGAAIRVADPAQLAAEAARVLTDEGLRSTMSAAAAAFAATHRGATARTLQLIETRWSLAP